MLTNTAVLLSVFDILQVAFFCLFCFCASYLYQYFSGPPLNLTNFLALATASGNEFVCATLHKALLHEPYFLLTF